MADIKTRDAVKGTIKTIDKAAVASERMKSAYSKIKSKAEQGYYADENSATEYAADKVSAASERITDEGVHQFNKQGQKGVKTTKDNVVTVIIAAITSRVRTKAKLPTHTAIKDFEGLSKDSVILLEQIRTIDKKRLRDHIGMLDSQQILTADKALLISLGLDKKD